MSANDRTNAIPCPNHGCTGVLAYSPWVAASREDPEEPPSIYCTECGATYEGIMAAWQAVEEWCDEEEGE